MDKDYVLEVDLEAALEIVFLGVLSLSLDRETPNKAAVFAFEYTLAWRVFGKLLVSLSIASKTGNELALDLGVEELLFLCFWEFPTCDM